jgi:hypothetical protein
MLCAGQDAESHVCLVCANDKTARWGADLTGYAHERRLPLCLNWKQCTGWSQADMREPMKSRIASLLRVP